ncbi:hypothetical protein ACFLQY_02360 [Verrucomicrobiota bacterium]
MDGFDQELMFQLQRDFPLAVEPFKVLAERLKSTEERVLARTQRFFDEGKARRFGAVFDARGLGYKSALCGVAVPEAEIDLAAAKICPHIGVTHCYVRDWPAELDPSLAGAPSQPRPNVWFTLAAPASQFDHEVARVQAHVAYPILVLPALQRFKIDVVFDPRAEKKPAASKPVQVAGSALNPDAKEQEMIRQLQQSLPVVSRPFAAIAEAAGMTEEALVQKMQAWRRQGALRRVAMILFHRKVGFTANAMCVWNVPPEQMDAAGKRLAARPEITHCYERSYSEAFPFNLYAMIHDSSWERTHALFRELCGVVGDVPANMLGSIRELKKVSPYYFGEAAEAEVR